MTPAQERVVEHLRKRGGWITLRELEAARGLEDDDFITVPSLIEAGLIEHNTLIGAVRCR
jgi:hypothetical protein